MQRMFNSNELIPLFNENQLELGIKFKTFIVHTISDKKNLTFKSTLAIIVGVKICR